MMAKWVSLLVFVATLIVSSLTMILAKTTMIRRVDALAPTVVMPLVSSEEDSDSVDGNNHTYHYSRSLLPSDADTDDDHSSSGSDDSDDDDSSESDDSDSSDKHMPVAIPANIMIGSTANTKDKIVSTYRNWVGPTIGKPSDPAFDKGCWRKAYIMDKCPYGFDYKLNTCWAECPMHYPVECGFECLRQGDDCALEIYAKFVSVANAFFSIQIMNAFGEFKKLSKTMRVGIKCARAMLGTMRAIVNYIRAIQMAGTVSSEDEVLLALYQTSYITIDLPVSIVMCMAKPYKEILDPISVAMGTIQTMLGEIVARQEGILESWNKFKAFLLRWNFTDAVNDLSDKDISSLKTGMESNSSCGYELQRLTDRTWRTIAEMKEADPEISKTDLRVAVYKSDLMLNDIPVVTNNCMEQLIMESDEATAYKTRDTLRKTYSAIVDDLIDRGKSDNGTSLNAKRSARLVADRTFMAIATLFYIDLTRVSGLLSEYIEVICGPTQLVGEIDDGTEPNTLGLRILGDAFNGTTLSWKRRGDGVVRIVFASNDTEDVTVNIISGGDKFSECDVPAGQTVTWTSTVQALGGRTLYLDRWRPGFLGLPGTGGGSLRLWVPQASEGGHFEFNVKINVS